MFMSLCCCGDPYPCFGCANKRFRIDWSKITVTHGGFSGFAYSDGDTNACNGVYTAPLGDITWSATQYFKSPNGIPTTLELWQAPAATITNGFGSNQTGTTVNVYPCQWLWNDCTAIPAVYHSVASKNFPAVQVNSELEVGTLYEPVNAVNASDPWNRVITTISDSRCTTLVMTGSTQRWTCRTEIIFTAIRVYIETISAVKYWRADAFVTFVTAAITNRSWWSISETDPADTAGFGLPGYPDIPYACIDFKPPGGGAFSMPSGGGFAIYRKEVDCSNDFDGSGIVLTHEPTAYNPRRDTFLGITCPSTMTIALNYL
jgi:hypothetical protein